MGLGLWERNVRAERAGMLPGFRLGSWMSGVHPVSLSPLAVALTDAMSHSLSVSWGIPPWKDSVVLVDDDG